MNIQYQRNLKHSYMVVIEPGQPLNMDGQLAEKMMQRQHIPGLLHWVTMEHEGDMTFWYQITGLQSLSDWLSHHMLDYKLFGHLLSGLLALQEELPRFYLKSEHLLLQPEQIFLNTSGEQVAFCYAPMWCREPRQSLQELMEQLLPKIDHTDKDAVRLGYGLYEKCQEENADVWQYVLKQHTEAFQMQQEPGETVDVVPAEEIPDCQEELLQESVKKVHVFKGYVDRKESIGKSVRKSLQQKDTYKAFSDKIGQKMPTVSALSWMKSIGKPKKEKPEPVYLFEPEEEEAVSENPTVFLGAKQVAEGRLVYRGEGEEANFWIKGDSFLLGGRNEQADGQLFASGVSRNHARITREDNRYYIEDLNSRNGTYLNGELLAYKQRRPVKPGDHLRFAREEYVFY